MGEDGAELKITYACRTDVGRVRDHNEDYAIIQAPSDPDKRRWGMAFVIADGMGGHQAGEVASERAARTVVLEYYASPFESVPERLQGALQAANAQVHQMAQANPDRTGMGTTTVMAVVRGREVHIANVGDSRAYLVRNGAITQITTDHSFVGEQVKAGILTKEQAKFHPQRNVITRALGSSATVQVDTYQGALQEGDVIVLCSDGLTEHVTDEALRDVVMRCDPDQAVIQLVELAKENGGSDNITVIVLRAEPAAGAPAAIGKSQPLPVMAPPGAPPIQPAAVALPAAQPVSPAAQQAGSPLVWAALGVIMALALIIGVAGIVLVLSRDWQARAVAPTATSSPAAQEIVLPSPVLSPVLPAATETPSGAATATMAPTFTPRPTDTPRPVAPSATLMPAPTLETPTPPPTDAPSGGGEKPTKEPQPTAAPTR